jgi:large subunit ribosomal protein L4
VVNVKKYDISGSEIGTLAIEDELLKNEAHSQMIKEYLMAIRRNARQWTAHTKVRSEVNHSHQKPHRQKGLGRSRQGSLAAPQYKGGGRVFGPRTKYDQHVRINRKEKRSAIKYFLAKKIEADKMCILQSVTMEKPKTKTIVDFLKKTGLYGKRILFLTNDKMASSKDYDNFVLSMRNIVKNETRLAVNASGYDLALCENVIVLEPAVENVMQILKKA